MPIQCLLPQAWVDAEKILPTNLPAALGASALAALYREWDDGAQSHL